MPQKTKSLPTTANVSIRISVPLKEEYDALAEQTGRTRNRLLTEALEMYSAVLNGGLMCAFDPKLADRVPAYLGGPKGETPRPL